ncbi:transcription elongation factor GreAB [Pseudomonas fluorescens ABAC62]|nr:transcription elongation factor GreAB [Pseudomonas fluorescens ABAC62]
MSRAFVNEDSAAAQADQPVERLVSEQPNRVTAQGLALLQARVAQLQQEHSEASARDDKQRLEFANEQDAQQRIQLVGEDQADAQANLINWGSPLGRALLGARVGDEVLWKRPVGDQIIEVLSVEPEA